MKDEQKISEVGVKENAFIVVMISKRKPQPAAATNSTTTTTAATSTPITTTPSPTQPTASSTTQPAATAPTTASPTQPTPTSTTTTTTPSQPTATTAAPQPASLTGVSDETINDLMAFGYTREQVIAALRAAFNNPDRAAEYLFSGIPSHLQQPSRPAPTAQSTAGAAERSASGTGSVPPITAERAAAAAARGGAQGPMDFSSLGIPQHELEQIRTLLASNPQLLQPLLQQLAQTNPELIQAIQANPQAFMNMLGVQPQQGAAGQGQQPGPGQHAIYVTEEEQAAIARLEGLGFERNRVLEAFLICDRNEEAAANYLLEHQFDEDELDIQAAQQGQGGQGQQGGDDEEFHGDEEMPE